MKTAMHSLSLRAVAFTVAALFCGLLADSASARTWFFDACGTVTVNGVPTSNVVVTAWGCENEVVSNDVVFADTVSDGQISNNYHIVYDVEVGEPGGSRAIDAYLVFSYGDCDPVVVDCETIHELNSIYGGKILLDVDILCLGSGGDPKTKGFWQNKNGQKLIDEEDIAMLNDCCLRNEDGSDADFADKKEFKAWIKKARAKNMAYMLSAQLAAMKLNVAEEFVDGGSMIYGPGCGDMEGDYLSIDDLMAAADAALCENGMTVESGDDRDYQECLKSALDDANNNLNFVQH